MNISNQTIIFLVIIGVMIIILILCLYNRTPIQNDGMLNVNELNGENGDEDIFENMQNDNIKKNRVMRGEYKKSNYADGKRGFGGESGKYFDESNNLSYSACDLQGRIEEPTGADEAEGKYASFKGGIKKKMTPEEIFNVDELLPNETVKDWFDPVPEPISVKDRHLINITRPIGVPTSHSKGHISYDMRGDIPNPKNIVPMWGNSSIEPEIYRSGIC